MTLQITYGLGGYDASKPNNNITRSVDVADDGTPDALSVLVEALQQASTIEEVQQAAADAAVFIDGV